MVKSIIFDLGGVVVGYDQRRVCRQLAKHCSATEDEIFDMVYRQRLDRPLEMGTWTGERFHRVLCERLGAKLSYEDFLRIWTDIFWPHQEVITIIRKLKGRYRLVALSNTDELHIGFLQREWGILDLFDDFVLSFQVGRAKPDPYIYRLALQKARAQPGQCIFIDDRQENVAAAAQLGILAFTYRDPEQLADHLKELGVEL